MRIKDIYLVRGLYFLLHNYFGSSRRRFGYIADNVIITPLLGDFKNIYIHNNVGIGPYAHISTPNAKVIIKDHCAVADHLTVHTGNHARLVGKFVTDISNTEKPADYDKDVVIEQDVWIGCNVTILAGVTIGRGATIAAGAVVNKNIPPYCIAGVYLLSPSNFIGA